MNDIPDAFIIGQEELGDFALPVGVLAVVALNAIISWLFVSIIRLF